MIKNYCFHLGRNNLLSLAELNSKLSEDLKNAELMNPDILLLPSTRSPEQITAMSEDMGGIKKVSLIDRSIPLSTNINSLISEITNMVENKALSINSKISIGINSYGHILPLQKIGMEVKKNLKNLKIKSRIVCNGSENLNSVSIQRNKLVGERGLDINIIMNKEKTYLSTTIFSQDSLFYSMRDYDRPRRGGKVGLLPPKLTQIMLNLSGAQQNDEILDPFCGFGTVAQEAALKKIVCHCSDIEEKRVEDTKENMDWLINKKPSLTSIINKIVVKQCDAKNMKNLFSEKQFKSIITEGTLGPPLKERPDEKSIQQTFRSLEELYLGFFTAKIRNLLHKNGKIVITFPVIKSNKNRLFYLSDHILPKISKLFTPIEILDKNLIKRFSLLQSNSLRYIYERKNQFVYRELIVFKQVANK